LVTIQLLRTCTQTACWSAGDAPCYSLDRFKMAKRHLTCVFTDLFTLVDHTAEHFPAPHRRAEGHDNRLMPRIKRIRIVRRPQALTT